MLLLLPLGCGDDGPTDRSTDAGPSDAGVLSSRGSGGLECERVGRSGDIDYCVVSVAGVELKVVEPEGATGPLDLALYLHGDGARAYSGDTALRIQAPITRVRPILYVAALAPNGCAWWLSPDYGPCDDAPTATDRDVAGANAAALGEAIEALRAAYDLRLDRTLFGGSSGGAVYLTGVHLPVLGDRHPGLYVLACGGGEPFASFAWDSSSVPLDGHELRFTLGDADFLREDVEAGVRTYEELGFDVTHTVLEGGIEHCGFDHLGLIADAWASVR